ncbi:MAG TPA: hypothetical protein VFQ15_04550, partial [Jiangellaceae bacterium]|nr:hypothetical protein [Jiangellaceae bacterium]
MTIARRLAATLPAVAGLALVTLGIAPASAGADPSAISVLQSVTPTVARPGDTLTLSGTVTNTGDVALVDVQALPRYHRTPLESRADISRVFTDPDLRRGQRYDSPLYY